MKKILLSLFVVAMVGVGLFGATKAWFTDTEGVVGNTFTTGTIDIAVDGENPWNRAVPYALNDMKPSYTDYIDFVIYNEGDNPANVWKTLKNFNTYNVKSSKPELIVDSTLSIHDIDNWINYDMMVKLYKVDPTQYPDAEPVWWETIYVDDDDVKIGSLEGINMYLGMIPVGWWMKVEQSYHMVDVGNEYQGDGMSFDIELYAEQLRNTVVLENKEMVQYGGGSHTLLGDSKYAELTYKVMDREFVYELNVYGMADGDYTLIKYDDPLNGSDPWPAPNSLALANVTVSGGTGNLPAGSSIELNQSMINAKIWLVKATYTPGSLTGALMWSPTTTLFETGLMDYYDSDL
ncbi:M73 family metallopeptidase [Patescibacteria group bacterium]|nr:M73 family metallopeptidase [Patescibacteria group bacterium]MBU1931767.1 M73 family metallopeptidase [Patescibacteria group bacterium]